jgi:hypothetical protein
LAVCFWYLCYLPLLWLLPALHPYRLCSLFADERKREGVLTQSIFNNLLIRCIWATRTAALSYSRFLGITTKPDCGCFQKLCPTVTNQRAIGFGTAVNCAFYCSGDKSIPYMAKVEVPDLNLANSRSSVCITTQPRVQLPKRIRRGFSCSLYDQPRPESHPTSPSYVE